MKYLLILLLLVVMTVLNAGGSVFLDNNSETNKTIMTSKDVQNNGDKKVDSHVIAAKQALSIGDYVKTIEEATVAIKDNANNAEAYSIRGFATALNGDTAKGLVDTKKAYDLDPNNVANYYNMAMVYKLQGQLNDSKQWFEKVLEKDPSNTWSVYGIATIYADQGDDTRALDWLEKAINIDPSVKAVAAEQDHFERFHNNERFKQLVDL